MGITHILQNLFFFSYHFFNFIFLFRTFTQRIGQFTDFISFNRFHIQHRIFRILRIIKQFIGNLCRFNQQIIERNSGYILLHIFIFSVDILIIKLFLIVPQWITIFNWTKLCVLQTINIIDHCLRYYWTVEPIKHSRCTHLSNSVLLIKRIFIVMILVSIFILGLRICHVIKRAVSLFTAILARTVTRSYQVISATIEIIIKITIDKGVNIFIVSLFFSFCIQWQ